MTGVASRPRWRRPMLRTQLVLLVLALLTLAFLLVAAVTTVELRHFLQNRLDQQLVAAGDRFSISLEHPNDHDADNSQQLGSVAGQAAGTLGARTLHGTVTAAAVVGHNGVDTPTAPDPAARSVIAKLSSARSPRTVDLPGLGEYRVLVRPGNDGDLLVTGLPIGDLDDTIARLLGIEAAVFGVALLVVGVSGAFSVRLALRPLNRIAQTASLVAGLPLSSGAVSLPARAAQRDEHTEVGTLSGAFDHMLEHVETSLQLRQDSEDRLRRFIADASHELRTPVAVIRSRAELARRTGGPLPAEVERSLQRIEAESERMGHLVDDLLLLARLDSGRPLAREEVDVTRLVLDAVGDARAAGPDHRWQLDLPAEPVSVTADEYALHQVLTNLLANARTHTPAGTTVLASTRDLADGGVEIVVGDDGPGIPAEVLPGIFERFVRADETRSATTGSSGLGLAIVTAIVHGLGGSIAVQSVPGNTRFIVRLGSAPRRPGSDGPEADTT